MSALNYPSKTSETVLHSIQNFCAAYSFRSCNIQLNRALSTIISGNYSGLTYSEKAELFDYFMALEDLMPALYELLEHLDKPIGDEGTYRDEVSAKDMYAKFKRHPE
ncbi:MAG: hypothetical protein Q8S11_01965 [Daejeonella sp.]|uniref:hypothetical protein n=1 Tax=Daejeonella sp. TaxID=2805397 RepID=UPI0027347037|nr:hypothetical protein [Daejeonella sp.]MDP3467069.1 hypothetical protein [Daejeonella sp.]